MNWPAASNNQVEKAFMQSGAFRTCYVIDLLEFCAC